MKTCSEDRISSSQSESCHYSLSVIFSSSPTIYSLGLWRGKELHNLYIKAVCLNMLEFFVCFVVVNFSSLIFNCLHPLATVEFCIWEMFLCQTYEKHGIQKHQTYLIFFFPELLVSMLQWVIAVGTQHVHLSTCKEQLWVGCAATPASRLHWEIRPCVTCIFCRRI